METEFRPTRSRAALGAALGVTTFAIGIALFPGGVAAQTTLECLGGGPQNTPAWALLSEATKSRICAGERSVDRRVADQRYGAIVKAFR